MKHGFETYPKTTKIAKTRRQAKRRKFSPEEKGGGGAKEWRDQREVLLSFIFWTGMPCQSFLIERNDHLRTASVGLTGRD